jgi:tetratricopeptide (TPR) repeat protein
MRTASAPGSITAFQTTIPWRALPSRGETELALDEFKKEIDADPVMWLTYWQMGEAYTRLDKWDLTEDALKKAIWINQHFTGPCVIMGKVTLKKGNLDVAAEFLERAVEMDPSNFEAHFQLGKVYKELGRSEDFKREFELSQKLRDVAKPKLESLR